MAGECGRVSIEVWIGVAGAETFLRAPAGIKDCKQRRQWGQREPWVGAPSFAGGMRAWGRVLTPRFTRSYLFSKGAGNREQWTCRELLISRL